MYFAVFWIFERTPTALPLFTNTRDWPVVGELVFVYSRYLEKRTRISTKTFTRVRSPKILLRGFLQIYNLLEIYFAYS